MVEGEKAWTIDPEAWQKAQSLYFRAGDREVLIITPEGKLIIPEHVEPREAAQALLNAWEQITGNRA